ncbi:hypothetical protein BGZ60DRAFT_391372 [Tricladium varicosporioides]|nr:hypothetical protein BGZ60DRAFT_391372 [Hymenoscyphus varicosporioides]
MAPRPIIAIVGATGGQGGSVVNTFLEDGSYQVRGITRNPDSGNAQALAARGVEIVAADLNNQESLVEAFKGASIIFAVTDFFEPFMKSGPTIAAQIEKTQGINLATAASLTPTLKHYIWSTLPNVREITNNKYSVPHFNGKNEIDDFILNNAGLKEKTTFLWVTWFASNFTSPLFKPTLLETSGKYVLIQPSGPETPVLSIGDQKKNVGPYVLAIASKPEVSLPGKFVLAAIEETTTGGLLKLWGEVNGKDTVFIQTDLETYDALFPAWGLEMGDMMDFWSEFKDKSWTREGADIITGNELGVKGEMVSVEAAVKAIDWNL